MATWPISLPQRVQRDGLAQRLESNTLRTPMEVGPDKLRHRTKSNYRGMEMSMVVTETQLLTLISFFENDIYKGSLPFTWADPIFQIIETFRFLEPPTWVPYGLQYKVALKMEMRVVGTRRPLAASDPWSLGMVETTGDIVPTSP